MNDRVREWYRMKFEGAFLRKEGQEFQNLFADLMEKRFPGDFERTRPQGKFGDHKTDGFLRSRGAVFQVYAPQKIELRKLLKKLEEDFSGALAHHQGELRQWIFVHNDFRGLPTEVYDRIEQLRRKHPAIALEMWGEEQLRRLLEELPETSLSVLFGPSPTLKDFDVIGFGEIAQVVEAIRTQPLDPDASEILEVPYDKLEANALSTAAKEFLLLGWHRVHLVEQYFGRHRNPAFGEEVARIFRQEYGRLRQSGWTSDQIFWQLQAFVSGGTRGEAEHEAAVLTVLAYFFEACDIFEPSRPEISG